MFHVIGAKLMYSFEVRTRCSSNSLPTLVQINSNEKGKKMLILKQRKEEVSEFEKSENNSFSEK